MPQVKDTNVKDGWYVNAAKDQDGKPRPLSLGAVFIFKPGQKKNLKAEMILQSRATHAAFTAALANGNLRPWGIEDKAAEPPPPEPVVEVEETEVVEEEVEEPEITGHTRSELMSMGKDELVKMCQDKGLDDTGSKNKMADRILVSQE